MTAAEIIRELHHHGGNVIVDGHELALTAPRPLPTGLVCELRTHKAELLTHLSTESRIFRLIESACQGLTITPEHLHAELEAGGDLPDLESGALTPRALRLAAETSALMRYPVPPVPDA